LGEKTEEDEEFETFNNLLDDNQDQVSSLSSDSYEGAHQYLLWGINRYQRLLRKIKFYNPSLPPDLESKCKEEIWRNGYPSFILHTLLGIYLLDLLLFLFDIQSISFNVLLSMCIAVSFVCAIASLKLDAKKGVKMVKFISIPLFFATPLVFTLISKYWASEKLYVLRELSFFLAFFLLYVNWKKGIGIICLFSTFKFCIIILFTLYPRNYFTTNELLLYILLDTIISCLILVMLTFLMNYSFLKTMESRQVVKEKDFAIKLLSTLTTPILLSTSTKKSDYL